MHLQGKGDDGRGGGEIRTIVIQHQTLVRQGIVGMLDATGDIQVVAHAGSGEEGVRFARDFQPDVVVVDADLSNDEGQCLVAEIKEALTGGKVLVVADRATQALVERTLADGADGYTLKDVTAGDFLEAIRRLAAGELVLHPTATAALARSFSSMANGGTGGQGLTRRQREIVELLVAGMQNKQIARRLDIGVETVKTHVSRIIDRLGVSSRTEVAVVALRDGLVA